MSDFDRLARLNAKIARRQAAALDFDAVGVLARQATLVLDTNTIVAALKKKLPPPVRALVAQSKMLASSVVVGEMTQGLYNLAPSHPHTPAARAPLQAAMAEMAKIPALTPTHNDWELANALLSVLSRTNGFDKVKRRELLGDALLYASARAVRACVVTADISDFDLFEQALPGGQVLYFTQLAKASSA